MPYGNGVLLWFGVDAFEAAMARARQLRAEIVHEPHLNPNAGQWDCWLRDPTATPLCSRVTRAKSGSQPPMYDPERGYPRVVPYVLYADPAAAVRSTSGTSPGPVAAVPRGGCCSWLLGLERL